VEIINDFCFYRCHSGYTSTQHTTLVQNNVCAKKPGMISGSSDKPGIGMPMRLCLTADWPPGQKHIVVVGAFNDGANQVILDTFV
jgi:hypothetical protein